MMQTATEQGVRLRDLFGNAEPGVPDLRVTDITTHSGRVKPGGLFLACQGYGGHGLEHLGDALAKSPAAIAWEPVAGIEPPELPAGVPGFPAAGLSASVGQIADRFFGSPSAELRVTGVTGTNGKTTTAWLVSQALNRMQQRTGYMGTLGYGIGESLEASALTTPGCIAVHRRLRELANAGAGCVVMEVSSHGLDQGRIDGVRVRTAAFTNLSRDHLDYHGDMMSYRAAKARLFEFASLESAVINVGDVFGRELAGRCGAGTELVTVAMREQLNPGTDAALTAELITVSNAGLAIRFAGRFGSAELHSPLWGRFNAENLLVATGILLVHGFTLDAAAAALAQCGAPAGRMEVVRGASGRPRVIVDFAHTPDGLAKALESVREHCAGRVTVVFGCGGERDTGKRAEMGAVASTLADRVVITNDNPRHEDPAAIIAMIESGIRADSQTIVEPDRDVAIRTAIAAAKADDVVLVAGKGSETHQYFAGRAERFSDVDAARAALAGSAS